MFIDDEAVEIAEEVQEEDTQDELTEEKTTDEDASLAEDFDGEIAPEDEIELGPITTTDESAEDESASETPSDETNEETVDAEEPKDEVDKAIYGMQKRIDKVTAQKGEKDAEIARLSAQIEVLTKSVDTIKDGKPAEKIYTDTQLDDAFEEAVADGDMKLIREIKRHYKANAEREAQAKNPQAQTQNQLTPQQQEETNTVVRNFGKYADKSITEIYPGSHTELDIMNPTSRLRRMAMAKYHGDPKSYSHNGGMVKAVTEAYTDILNIRLGVKAKQKNAADTLLKNKVKKLQREKSQGSSSAMGARKNNTPKKSKTKSQQTIDYVAERKKILV